MINTYINWMVSLSNLDKFMYILLEYPTFVLLYFYLKLREEEDDKQWKIKKQNLK